MKAESLEQAILSPTVSSSIRALLHLSEQTALRGLLEVGIVAAATRQLALKAKTERNCIARDIEGSERTYLVSNRIAKTGIMRQWLETLLSISRALDDLYTVVVLIK